MLIKTLHRKSAYHTLTEKLCFKSYLTEIPDDCLALQCGETAQMFSGGLLRATPHCVRLLTNQRSSEVLVVELLMQHGLFFTKFSSKSILKYFHYISMIRSCKNPEISREQMALFMDSEATTEMKIPEYDISPISSQVNNNLSIMITVNNNQSIMITAQ